MCGGEMGLGGEVGDMQRGCNAVGLQCGEVGAMMRCGIVAMVEVI